MEAKTKGLTALVAFVLVSGALFCSCDVPVDRGVFNPTGVAEDKLVTVKISPNMDVSKVDNQPVYWKHPDNNYSQIVRMAPGIHVFEVSYNDGVTWTLQPISAVAKLASGNGYTISHIITDQNISIQIGTRKNGVEESALFNMNSLSEEDGPLAVYVLKVFNPTLVSTAGRVLLSNYDEEIMFEYDLVYRKTDKKTGKKTEGRYAIEMDFTLGGRIYFLEADLSALSSEAFLERDFRQEAEIIAVPVQCDGETVTYRYSRPESFADRADVYTIANLTPVPAFVD
ncbi:MAG: hypothetical protein LBD44_04955 [Spirochaetaceae bacterium]|jgi:hypothetical protein|nr:hypothetical protein [Spirochaetaceae bacterium]